MTLLNLIEQECKKSGSAYFHKNDLYPLFTKYITQMTELTDLQKFTILFGLEFKQLKNGLEYRVQDLDRDLQRAKLIIKENSLNLTAQCEGSSAGMKSFFLRIKND